MTDGRQETFANIPASEQSLGLGLLGDLALATTAYHEAPPERAEAARLQYEAALAKFNVSGPEESK